MISFASGFSQAYLAGTIKLCRAKVVSDTMVMTDAKAIQLDYVSAVKHNYADTLTLVDAIETNLALV